jgi:hypothetical protein
LFKLHHLLPSPLFFYFQAAKETGALQAAKNKLEKQVEELTWRLQLEKRMRVKFWFTLFDRCSGFVYLHGRDIKKMINYVKFTLLTTQHMPIEYRLNFSEWVQKYAVAFFFLELRRRSACHFIKKSRNRNVQHGRTGNTTTIHNLTNQPEKNRKT